MASRKAYPSYGKDCHTKSQLIIRLTDEAREAWEDTKTLLGSSKTHVEVLQWLLDCAKHERGILAGQRESAKSLRAESLAVHTASSAQTDDPGEEEWDGQVVRYGIIGSGMMGVEHIHNLNVIDGVCVVAIADPHVPSQQAGLAACARGPPLLGSPRPNVQVFANYGELLDSRMCDVVVVATPNMTHAQVLLDILAHAHPPHILVEKPLCTNIADCYKVMEASKGRPEVLLQVGLEYRYMPPVARLIGEVRRGTVGDIRMVAIREHRFPFLVKVDNWNRFSRNTGGTLVEKCCHFFDLMNLITNSKPVRVFASGGQDVNHLDESYNGQVPDILDNAYVIVDYEGDVRGMLDLCMFAEGSRNEQEIAATGNKGKVEALVTEGIVRIGERTLGQAGVEAISCHDSRIKYEGYHHGSSYLEHLDFLEAVRSHGQKPSVVSLDDGLMSVAIGVAAHRSIDLGRPVYIKEIL